MHILRLFHHSLMQGLSTAHLVRAKHCSRHRARGHSPAVMTIIVKFQNEITFLIKIH